MRERLISSKRSGRRILALALATLATPVQIAIAADSGAEGSAGKPALTAADYRVAPRDLLKVEIYNQPDMETLQRLTAQGDIRLPLVGIVAIAGMTVRQAELEIESRYVREGFFNSPQVSIAVQEFAERFISVLGEVNTPGRIAFTAEAQSFGMLEALAQAGGFTRLARSDSVQVTRRGADGREETKIVNVEALLDPGNRQTSREARLYPGDVIFIPERVF